MAPAPPDDMRIHDANEPPPFLGTWGRVYGVVLGFLAFLIILMLLFMRTFA